jgi:hypothetical protein
VTRRGPARRSCAAPRCAAARGRDAGRHGPMPSCRRRRARRRRRPGSRRSCAPRRRTAPRAPIAWRSARAGWLASFQTIQASTSGYHCPCQHAFQVFGLGRRCRYYGLADLNWQDPVTARICPARVNGHRVLPTGGHRMSPLAAMFFPHRWPRFLPAWGSARVVAEPSPERSNVGSRAYPAGQDFSPEPESHRSPVAPRRGAWGK